MFKRRERIEGARVRGWGGEGRMWKGDKREKEVEHDLLEGRKTIVQSH